MTALSPSTTAAAWGRGSSRAAAGQRVAPPLLLTGLAALVYALPDATGWLELDRAGLQAGELWRLLTGHWTHWNLAHLVWDGVAFVALGTQCWQISPRLFWRCVLGSALAVSAMVLVCQPEITSYRGLSGIDAAFFAALAVDTVRHARRAGRSGPLLATLVAGALFAAKLIYESVTGTAFFVDLGPGVVPLPLAHLVGAGVGAVAAQALGGVPSRAGAGPPQPGRDGSAGGPHDERGGEPNRSAPREAARASSGRRGARVRALVQL